MNLWYDESQLTSGISYKKNFSFQALPWSFSQKCTLVALYPIWKMRNISFFPHSDCLLMFNSFWIFTDSRHETDFSRTWIAWPYKRSRILEVDDDDVPGLSEPGEGRGGTGPSIFLVDFNPISSRRADNANHITKGGLKTESAEGFSIAKDRCRKAILNYYILYTAMIKY